jgi:hypothetical protein
MEGITETVGPATPPHETSDDESRVPKRAAPEPTNLSEEQRVAIDALVEVAFRNPASKRAMLQRWCTRKFCTAETMDENLVTLFLSLYSPVKLALTPTTGQVELFSSPLLGLEMHPDAAPFNTEDACDALLDLTHSPLEMFLFNQSRTTTLYHTFRGNAYLHARLLECDLVREFVNLHLLVPDLHPDSKAKACEVFSQALTATETRYVGPTKEITDHVKAMITSTLVYINRWHMPHRPRSHVM